MISLTFSLSFMLQLSFCFFSSHSKVVDDKTLVTSLESLCMSTLYPKSCYDTLSKSPLINPKQSYNLTFFYNQSVQVSIGEVTRVSNSFQENGALSRTIKDTNEKVWQSALESCRNSFSHALYDLNWCVRNDDDNVVSSRSELKSWLSAARAHLQTCSKGFEYAQNEIPNVVTAILDNPTKAVTTSLAILSKIDEMSPDDEETEAAVMDTPGSGELTKHDWESIWSYSEENNYQSKGVYPNAVVAKDGSGKYRTITDAINAAPQWSRNRFVIYVKKGVYYENIMVLKEKWNILMYGDGMWNTIISGNRCNQTGYSTANSFTFAVWGMGFIAKDIGFRNSAGPRSGQAVALLSGSYQSVFYRCLIDGYQDSLYTHSQIQFYRECQIYGSVDFIFGYAAAVIQNSDIYVRRPSKFGGIATITAQGKGDAYHQSGISIQNCNIQAAENLRGILTYLGRPWVSYSTVVVMESKLGSLIDPSGWLAWDGQAVPRTIDYVEYNNWGPGAVTTHRVNWTGVTLNNSRFEASKFTVNSFIDGARWLPWTGVPFNGWF